MKSKSLEILFSTKDSFRSNLADILYIYSAVDKVGVTRVSLGQRGVVLSLMLAIRSE